MESLFIQLSDDINKQINIGWSLHITSQKLSYLLQEIY